MIDSEWHDIKNEKPEKPCMVLYYSKNLMLIDYKTNKPVSPKMEPWRDEAYELGFFDGKSFRYIGTGHEVFEFDYQETDDRSPTDWAYILEAPCTSARAALGEKE